MNAVMGTESECKIVLVTRQTRLQELVQRFNTEGQARFYIEHLGADFSDYQAEHTQYQQQLRKVQQALARIGRLQSLDRSFVPNYLFGPRDIVVVLGQDGLVANTLKYLDGQPLVGVNPDPARWEGILLPFQSDDLPQLLPEVFRNQRPCREVTMAEAVLNDGQRLYAVNDFFVGPRSHTSAHYRIEIGAHSEEHSSSGVIVSTGLGSTGWLRSILTGAAGIARAAGNAIKLETKSMAWDAADLVFSVREPWPSRTSAATIVFGRATANDPLRLLSRMPEHGVIFSDGIESDYLAFNSGTQALIGPAERKGRLVL
jgi:NAD kinase